MPSLRKFTLPSELFSINSAWYQKADAAPVNPDNAKFVAAVFHIFQQDGITPTMAVNFDEFTFPIFEARQTGGPLGCDLEILTYDQESRFHPTTVPWYWLTQGRERMFARGVSLPDGQVRPSLPETQKSDGALILYNPATQEEFDFWQATTVADQFGGVEGPTIVRAGEVAWFCIGVDAPGCQLPVCEFGRPGSLWRGSCRSTGVPYLAGLLVPEDFKSQSGIPHALAFTLPRLRYIEETSSGVPANHVYPATATEHETDNSTSNPFALAAGMRLRFGSTVVDKNGNAVNEAALAPVTKLFFQALRKYGAYLLDAAGAFGFAAEDQWTAPLELSIPDLADLVGTTVESISATIDNGKTQWEILMSKLREEVEQIPFAVSANQGNFEVIADAKLPPPQ